MSDGLDAGWLIERETDVVLAQDHLVVHQKLRQPFKHVVKFISRLLAQI